MKPEDFAKELERAIPEEVQSMILYGSAAAGDFIDRESDYNLLLVLRQTGLQQLKALAKPLKDWLKAGNPPPVLFTLERLKSSADVFPLELLDMKENHRVLLGQDVLAEVHVSDFNLRHQLEFELKSKLLQLEARYLVLAGSGSDRELSRLMIDSLSAFLVLGRGALRLYQKETPASKLESIRLLARQLDIRAEVFEMIHQLKTGEKKLGEVEAEQLFGQYLGQIEALVRAVDQYVRRTHPKT